MVTPRPVSLPRALPRRRPAAGARLTADRRKGALVDAAYDLTVTGKLSVTSDLSNLDQFVTLAGKPTIASGILGGGAVVRHRAEALSDAHKVTVTIGSVAPGKTRLVICSDADFTKYYGLEIETGLINNKFHIIKGRGTDALLDGYIFSEVDKFDTTTVFTAVGDQVSVWYDRAHDMIRGYKGATEVVQLAVDPREIAHGVGNRHHGVAVGVDLVFSLNPGALPTAYTAVDV